MSPGGLPSTVLPAADPGGRGPPRPRPLRRAAGPAPRRSRRGRRRPPTISRRLGGPRRRRSATRSSAMPRIASATTAASTRCGRMAGAGRDTCAGRSRPTSGSSAACAGSQEMAAAIGEVDEAERCGQFLQQLDPGPVRRRDGTSRRHRRCRAVRRARAARFGRDKSLVEIDGRPMAEHVAATLEAAGCQPVVFVGWCREPSWRRRRVGRSSPTRGLVRARSAASSMPSRWFRRRAADGVVVAACDLPSLTVDAVRAVAGGGGPAVAVAERPHPSLARWPVSAAAQVASAVRRRRAVVARGARSARRQSGDGCRSRRPQRQSAN